MMSGPEVDDRDESGAARPAPAAALRAMSAASLIGRFPVPVAIVADGGVIVDANAALSALLGRAVAGEPLAAVVSEAADASDPMAWLDGAVRRLVTLVHSGGTPVPATLTASVHHAQDASLAVVVFDDATDRVWMGELTG